MALRSGFIYLWRDRKSGQFYLGSHLGFEDDGYVCSSRWMRSAYKKRPGDFKRRIIKRVGSYDELITEEQRFLDMIKPEEFGVKYFNYQPKAKGWSWHQYDNVAKKEVVAKSAKARTGLKRSEEFSEVMRQSQIKNWQIPEYRQNAIAKAVARGRNDEALNKMVATTKERREAGLIHPGVKKGIRWFNNGSVEVFQYEQPEGFVRGRLSTSFTNMHAANPNHLKKAAL